MKIEMEFQGLKELMKANLQDAASDEDIRAVNKKIVEQGEPVVKRIYVGEDSKIGRYKVERSRIRLKIIGHITRSGQRSTGGGQGERHRSVSGCRMGKVG